jgi:lipopolysaccharide export system protein LptA
MVSRTMVALAYLLALAAPSVAQGNHPEGRIVATFNQAQGTAQRSKVSAAAPDKVLGAFTVDPEAPIHIEADRLVEFDGAKQAVFTGIVKLQQGDFQLRTVSLTAFYSGQSGFSTGGEWRAEQLTRAEARERVLILSKDGQTSATADWATVDVMANTVLMGDNVFVSRGKNMANGPRLRIDLTTGKYLFEIESGPASPRPSGAQVRPE